METARTSGVKVATIFFLSDNIAYSPEIYSESIAGKSEVKNPPVAIFFSYKENREA
jgi:hypothetical protein